MKKLISVILLFLLVLSLFGCAKPAKEGAAQNQEAVSQEKTFRGGYARMDITPEEPVPLGGFGNCDKRISTVILRRLYVTCVDMDEENREKGKSKIARRARPYMCACIYVCVYVYVYFGSGRPRARG